MRISLLQMLKNLRKNLSYMLKFSLPKREEQLTFDILNKVEEIYYYSILDNDVDRSVEYPRLNVLSKENTIKYIFDNEKSFCRFGDGEIRLMMGYSIPFQKYDERLAKKLLAILKSDSDKISIGIPYQYFYGIKNANETSKKFWLFFVPEYRKFLLKHCLHSKIYIDTGFTQIYMSSNDNNYHNYFNKTKNLFNNKKLLIVSGNGILKKLKYNIFENALQKNYIYAPSINAYDEYDELLNKCLKFPKDTVIILMIGPTSKVLAYELANNGYTAYDVGHLAEDYDAYKNNVDRSDEQVIKFFEPN